MVDAPAHEPLYILHVTPDLTALAGNKLAARQASLRGSTRGMGLGRCRGVTLPLVPGRRSCSSRPLVLVPFAGHNLLEDLVRIRLEVCRAAQRPGPGANGANRHGPWDEPPPGGVLASVPVPRGRDRRDTASPDRNSCPLKEGPDASSCRSGAGLVRWQGARPCHLGKSPVSNSVLVGGGGIGRCHQARTLDSGPFCRWIRGRESGTGQLHAFALEHRSSRCRRCRGGGTACVDIAGCRRRLMGGPSSCSGQHGRCCRDVRGMGAGPGRLGQTRPHLLGDVPWSGPRAVPAVVLCYRRSGRIPQRVHPFDHVNGRVRVS